MKKYYWKSTQKLFKASVAHSANNVGAFGIGIKLFRSFVVKGWRGAIKGVVQAFSINNNSWETYIQDELCKNFKFNYDHFQKKNFFE